MAREITVLKQRLLVPQSTKTSPVVQTKRMLLNQSPQAANGQTKIPQKVKVKHLLAKAIFRADITLGKSDFGQPSKANKDLGFGNRRSSPPA